MKKKVLAWVLTVAMVLTNLPMISFADNSYSIGDTITDTNINRELPTDIPDGTNWEGPQQTRTCTVAAHRHDEDCYCKHGGTSLSHWWHDNSCRLENPDCGLAEHTHSVENNCYSYTWVLEETTTSDQHRTWWPVYWGFEDGSRVTSSDVVTVTSGSDSVKFASTTVSASTGLADVEDGNTVNSGTVIDNDGFSVVVDPGYYVVSWRLVCGNRFRCATNDYQDRNYTANSDGDYTSEILVPMDEESFNHWNGFDIQNSNSNGNYYVPVIAPESTDTNLYNSGAPYPFYLMVYVQQDTATYEINYDWGLLKAALTEYPVPDSEHNVIRNASYEVADPDAYGGETMANELGYRFTGWQISGEGYDDDATVQPGASITCYGSDITLTAIWEWDSSVAYQYIGDVPGGAEKAPETKIYTVNEQVVVEDEPQPVPGYTFSGWTTNDVDVINDKFIMPGTPVVFEGSFVKNPDDTKTISYTVEYYFDHKKDLDRQKDVIVSETVWAGEDDYLPVNAQALVKNFDGWVFGGSDPDVLPDQAANGDVIKLYYHNTNVEIDVQKEVANLTQGIAKTDTSLTDPLAAKVGDVLEYTITVTNKNQKVAAEKIVICDTLNGYGIITFTATDNIAYEHNQTQDVFRIHTIPANGSVSITYTYTVHEKDEGQNLTNFAFYSDGDGGDSAYVGVESQYTLTVEHYLDGELDDDLTVTKAMDKDTVWTVEVDGTNKDNTYNAPISITSDGTTYAFDEIVTGFKKKTGTLTEDTTVKLYYATDEIGTEDPDQPDDIPDKYQVTILYVAEHGGSIAEGALTEEVVTIYDKNGKLAEKGIITATGSEAVADTANHYAFARWTLERQNHAAFEIQAKAEFGPYQMPPRGSEAVEAYYAVGGSTYIFRAHFIGAELELIKSATVFSKTRSAEEQNATPIAEVGDTIEYEIHVHNTGTVHLKNLIVTDTMTNAAGTIRYDQSENSNLVSYNAEADKFTVIDLQPGQMVTIVYYYDVVEADAGKDIKNVVVADLDGNDDPSSTEEVYVKEVILSVEKTANDYEVAAGETITWDIVVSNSGKDAGYTALPTDTLTIQAEGQAPTTVDLEVKPAAGLTAENDGTYKVPGKGSITFVASYVSKADGVVLTNKAAIDGDEDTDEPVNVLKNYTVTYVLQGEIPSGMNAAYHGPTEHVEKGIVTVLDEPDYDKNTYGFSGWVCDDVEVTNGTFTMPGKDITFVGVFEAYNPDIKVVKNTLKINEQDYVKGTSVAKPGDWITWQISVTNDGNAAGKYTLTDQLAGVTVYDENNRIVSAIQEFTIPANGAAQTFTAKYQVKDTDTGSIVNSVKLSSGGEDNTDGEEVPISNLKVLDKKVIKVGSTEITAGVTIPEAKVGETIIWEITLQNTGDADTTMNVSDLGDTVQYKSGSSWVDFTGNAGKVSFNVTEITVPAAAEDGTPGQAVVQVSWVVPNEAYGKTVRNLVDSDPDDGKDPEPEIPSEEIDVEIQPISGLIVDKTVDKTKVKVGDTVTYTITIKNSGNMKLVHVVVDEEAFSGKFDKIIDIDLSAEDITVDKENDLFIIGDLMPEEEVSITFSYKTTEEGTLKNTVKVTGQPDRDGDGQPDPNLPNPNGEDKSPDVEVDGENEPKPPVVPTPGLNKRGDHLSYIIGFPDGSVQPLSTITRAEVATIFFRLLTDESRAHYWSQENPFSDVAATDWCNNAISTMYNAGIIKGYPDGTFGPSDPVSRAEFAAIATRFTEEGRDGVSQKYFKQYFKDVDQDDWYAAAVELAYELGWAQGYQGNYRPEDDMTRAEAMTLVNRIMEREVRTGDMLEDMIHWPDNDPDMWYYEAVQEATNSHTYKRTNVKVPHLTFYYEEWKKLLENPDWAALERTWSEANSQN